MKQNVPAYILESIALGEADARTIARAKRALGRGFQKAIDDIKKSDAAVLASYPPDTMVRKIRHAAKGTSAMRLALRTAPFLAAAAALLIIFIPGRFTQTHTEDDGGIRSKGEPRLFLIRNSGGRPEELAQNARAHAGDQIQIRYLSGGAAYGVIISIDGGGTATLHFPYSPRSSSALAAGSVSLKESYELDDAPSHETFMFIAGKTPIDAAAALASVRSFSPKGDIAAQAKHAFPDAAVTVFRLQKE